MKKVFTALFLFAIIVSVSNAQVWQFDKVFSEETNPHAVLVTPDGKVWVGNYSERDTVITGTDTLVTRPIKVYSNTGVLEQTIRFITVSGVTDTLVNTTRGMTLDNDGNVLFTNWNVVYRINYQTYAGMNKFDPDDNGSMTEAAVDAAGYIYLAHVGGGHASYILNPDLTLFSFVTDTLQGLQRSLLVSPDGNDVYFGKIYTSGYGVWHYQSTDGFGAESASFANVDTLGTVFGDSGKVANAMWAQCLDWDNNGLMWVGTYWNVDTVDFNGWYALDPTQNFAVVDTIGHNYYPTSGDATVRPEDGSFYSPRGITFTADGKTAYTADFDGGLVMQWTNAAPKKPGDAVIPLSDLIVSAIGDLNNPTVLVNFDLKQNYPNPFNPTTTIPFTVNKTKHVTLKVYDVTGKLISTLIDKQLAPNHYEFKFNGNHLASGSYIYQLNVDGQLVNKRMLLIK